MIFIRDEEFRVRNTRKKTVKPNDGWRRLLSMMKSKKTGGGSARDRGQRVYFHVRYSSVNSDYGKKLARAHLNYIVRDGVGKDGKDPELYGNITSEELLDIKPTEENHFRFILSPERLGNIDLKTFVESYMRYISARTGYRLQWVAANHYNTAHPHAHIIIKGVDRDFKVVRFSRYQIRQTFREIAQNFLTYLLGERTVNQEIKLAKARSTYYGYLDKKIAIALGENNTLELDKIEKTFRSSDIDLIKERLTFLAGIKLINRTETGYHFPKGWIDILKQIGRSDNFLMALKSIKYNHPTFTVRFDKDKHKNLCGIISYIGKKDELLDSNFMIIEAIDGKNYICNLSPFSKLKTGEIVVFDIQKFRKIKSVREMESLLKGKPESPLKQQITRTIINSEKDLYR